MMLILRSAILLSPCVNGVPKATDPLQDGDLVTVDGYLGIVTVGAAEIEPEKSLDISKLG